MGTTVVCDRAFGEEYVERATEMMLSLLHIDLVHILPMSLTGEGKEWLLSHH